MDRRGFLGSILAACVAPAIVRADSLMRIVSRELLVLEAPVAKTVTLTAFQRTLYPMLQMAVAPGGVFQWRAFPGEEIIGLDDIASHRQGGVLVHRVGGRMLSVVNNGDSPACVTLMSDGSTRIVAAHA